MVNFPKTASCPPLHHSVLFEMNKYLRLLMALRGQMLTESRHGTWLLEENNIYADDYILVYTGSIHKAINSTPTQILTTLLFTPV